MTPSTSIRHSMGSPAESLPKYSWSSGSWLPGQDSPSINSIARTMFDFPALFSPTRTSGRDLGTRSWSGPLTDRYFVIRTRVSRDIPLHCRPQAVARQELPVRVPSQRVLAEAQCWPCQFTLAWFGADGG